MAKINKYWGMVALGAATAAVAGAVAAAFAKDMLWKRQLTLKMSRKMTSSLKQRMSTKIS